MRSVSGSKQVLAIVPVNRDCLNFVFKDGTNTTLTYRELRDSWNGMNGFKEEMAVQKRPEKVASNRSRVARSSIAPVREPVAHSQFPKLHPLAKPRKMTFES